MLVVATLWAVVVMAEPKQIDIDDDQLYRNDQTLVYDGIDVSSYQKDIDWSTTAADRNIKFVYVKATEGATFTSNHYRRNIENARRYGVRVGSYHFLRTASSIRSQFENFISVVKKEEQDLVPLIDVEYRRGWTNQQLRDSVKLFADLLEEYYGCRPMIYTSSSFFNAYLAPDFVDYPLFIARYSKSRPQLTHGAKWILWQFSERGRIQGIDAYVDLCRFNAGCGLNDILMKKTVSRRRPRTVAPQTRVPEPATKRVQAPSQQPVPLSEKQKKALEKQEKEQKKLLEKKAKEDREAYERKQKEAEKAAKEEAKKQEKLKKQQEKELKKKAEQQRKEQQTRQQQLKQKQAKQQTDKKKNQSSADNDGDIYMPTRRSR